MHYRTFEFQVNEVLPPLSPYKQAVLADNPYLYYPFDEADPTAVALSLVNQAASNNLVPYDGATRVASGTTPGGVSLGQATFSPNWGSRFQTGVGNGQIGDGSIGVLDNPWAVEFWFRSTDDAEQYIWATPNDWPHMVYGHDKTAPDPSQEVYAGWPRWASPRMNGTTSSSPGTPTPRTKSFGSTAPWPIRAAASRPGCRWTSWRSAAGLTAWAGTSMGRSTSLRSTSWAVVWPCSRPRWPTSPTTTTWRRPRSPSPSRLDWV